MSRFVSQQRNESWRRGPRCARAPVLPPCSRGDHKPSVVIWVSPGRHHHQVSSLGNHSKKGFVRKPTIELSILLMFCMRGAKLIEFAMVYAYFEASWPLKSFRMKGRSLFLPPSIVSRLIAEKELFRPHRGSRNKVADVVFVIMLHRSTHIQHQLTQPTIAT